MDSYAHAQNGEWTHVDASQDPTFRGLPRFLALSDQPPPDVVADKSLPEFTRFAQLRFGSFDSRRVTIAIVPEDDGSRMYVDANRDRRITDRDRIEGMGPAWTVPLEAEFVDGDFLRSDERTIQFRIARGKLTVAAAGFLEGTVELGAKSILVRRVDANGNGQFADEADHIWIDLNGDSKWNLFSERFPFSSIMQLNGQRYFTASDLRGHRFDLSPNTETGTLELSISDEMRQRGLLELNVVLTGRGGSIVHLNQDSAPTRVPADDYRPISIVATFTRESHPQVWTFTFVGGDADGEDSWTQVAADSQTSVDPLQELRFVAYLNRLDSAYSPGSALVVNPRLLTVHGLQLQAAFFGREQSESGGEPVATVLVVDPQSEVTVGRRTCGFT